MTEQPKEMKLIGKLCEVMEEVQYIQKTGYNSKQNYRYAQETDVVEKCRAELAKRKVWLKHSVKEVTNNRTVKTRSGGEMTVIRAIVEFTFIDAESGERETFTEPGEGMDSGDKAIYKAITGALKYALMKSFMIPTGDDPENDGEEAPKQQPKQQQPKQQKQSRARQQTKKQPEPKEPKMDDEQAISISLLVVDITGDDSAKKNQLEMWLRNKVNGFKGLDEDMSHPMAEMVIQYLKAYQSRLQEREEAQANG